MNRHPLPRKVLAVLPRVSCRALRQGGGPPGSSGGRLSPDPMEPTPGPQGCPTRLAGAAQLPQAQCSVSGGSGQKAAERLAGRGLPRHSDPGGDGGLLRPPSQASRAFSTLDSKSDARQERLGWGRWAHPATARRDGTARPGPQTAPRSWLNLGTTGPEGRCHRSC